ncbi:MAG: LuxR C-terminal-related transcriptional regulator [Actinomycetota bacterium]|nr:LuxR C-terminal-related transcriptional regulator [Actinomycetota bacterium]
MGGDAGGTTKTVRAAEVVAAACLATDLGMGLPFEHGLHATLMAMRLAELLEVDQGTATQTYYGSLLMYSGCTTDAAVLVDIVGGSMTETAGPTLFGPPVQSLTGLVRALPTPYSLSYRRAYETATRLPRFLTVARPHLRAVCEVAEMLAERLGLPTNVQALFSFMTERWDGYGLLRRAQGDEIPLALRIAHVARDAALQRHLGGDDYAAEVIRERAGGAFDPLVARRFADDARKIMSGVDASGSAWDATLAAEPCPRLSLEGEAIERAFAAVGDFADLISPWLAGHSGGVARLATAAGQRCGLSASDVRLVRWAALVHDVGRVAVHPRTWAKAGPLSADEWEQVRLHAYHTERILGRGDVLAAAGEVAGAHHERLDGSGYHRNATASSLPPTARLLATADAFTAMTEPRPHRDALGAEEAAELLRREANARRHDPELFAGVLEAAGQPVPRVELPAVLTEREVEVVRLLARGCQTKQVARTLGISVKTADHHIQNAYRKMDVSTRAGATLFAMEHGLII